MGLHRPLKLLESCAMKWVCQAMIWGPVFVKQRTHTCTQSDMVCVGGSMKDVCVCLPAQVRGGEATTVSIWWGEVLPPAAAKYCSFSDASALSSGSGSLLWGTDVTAELEAEGMCLMPKAWDLARQAHKSYLARSGSHPLPLSQFRWCQWGFLVILQKEVVVFKKRD